MAKYRIVEATAFITLNRWIRGNGIIIGVSNVEIFSIIDYKCDEETINNIISNLPMRFYCSHIKACDFKACDSCLSRFVCFTRR